MKKLFLLLSFSLLFFSCEIDDSDNVYSYDDLVAVQSVSIPDTLVFEETYTFEVSYLKPTTCHTFAGYSYSANENERIIGVINTIYYNNETTCEDLTNELITKELVFEVLRDDYYIFKFWQGENNDGENIYLTKEVPIKTE